MPRGTVTKVDLLSRVYKLKTELHNGHHSDKSAEWHDGAHDSLSKVLDILNEFSR